MVLFQMLLQPARARRRALREGTDEACLLPIGAWMHQCAVADTVDSRVQHQRGALAVAAKRTVLKAPV